MLISAPPPPSQVVLRPSTPFCYSLAALLQLDDAKWVSSPFVARRTRMPPKYLRTVLTQLVKQGLVEAKYGTNGGFRLAKPLGKITVLDVLVAVDGPVGVDDDDLHTGMTDGSVQMLRQVLDGMAGDVARRLGVVTLAELAER